MVTYSALFHFVGTACLIGMFYQWTCVMEPVTLLIGYTQWGLVMTIISFLLLSLFPNNPKNTIGQLTRVFVEIAWSSEFVIVIFFWCVLFLHGVIAKSPITDGEFWYYLDVHSVPFILLLIEIKRFPYSFQLSDLKYTFIPFILYAGFAFSFVYFYDTSMHYYLLDWKDWWSAVTCAALGVLNALGFHLGRIIVVKKEVKTKKSN